MNPPRLNPSVWWRCALALVCAPIACAGVKSGAAASPAGGPTGNGACATASCVGLVHGPLALAVEIDPPASSGAGVSQTPSLDLSGGALRVPLRADTETSVAVTFNAPANGTVPANANVVLNVPAAIPGLPDLSFQAPLVVDPMTPGAFGAKKIAVPSWVLGRAATLVLSPLPPSDQQNPPRTFAVTLGTTMTIPIPGDDFTIGGTLLDAIGNPPSPPFVARAFQAGALVSSAPQTQSDGSFLLVLPSAVAAAGGALTIQLTPQLAAQTSSASTQGAVAPWFVSNPVASPYPASLGTLSLAAYINPNQFNVLVQGPDQTGVVGALVQAQLAVGKTAAGTTSFSNTAITASGGLAGLQLLPGSALGALYYAFSVVPPAGSPFATTCLPSASVLTGSALGSASAPTAVTVTLSRRPTLQGTVTDANGRPISNVAVTATPGPGPTETCASTPAAAGDTATDAQGAFTLPLDPGTYQLDYDPPAGSSAPRFTEMGVALNGTSSSAPVALPAGGLVSGLVTLADGQTPLPAATVRFFEPRCPSAPCSSPPWLRGQAVSDANGRFQVVVPLTP